MVIRLTGDRFWAVDFAPSLEFSGVASTVEYHYISDISSLFSFPIDA